MRPTARAVIALAEELHRQAIHGMLLECGFRGIKLCYNCDDILSVMNGASGRWKILILDHSLPNALDTLRLLRRRLGPHLKIVVVIPSPKKSDILEAAEAGADDIVTFPISPAAFEKKIQRLTAVPDALPAAAETASG